MLLCEPGCRRICRPSMRLCRMGRSWTKSSGRRSTSPIRTATSSTPGNDTSNVLSRASSPAGRASRIAFEPSSPPSSSSPTSGRDKAVTATRRHDASSSASSKRPPPPPVPTARMPFAGGGRTILPASRGSSFSTPPPSGWPSSSQHSRTKGVSQSPTMRRTAFPSRRWTPCTAFVQVAAARFRTRFGVRPDMQVRKKSGTRTSGTEYQGLRIRHLYPFRTCLPRSLSRYSETAAGRSASFGIRRRHHGLVGTPPPLDGPRGQGPGRQHPAVSHRRMEKPLQDPPRFCERRVIGVLPSVPLGIEYARTGTRLRERPMRARVPRSAQAPRGRSRPRPMMWRWISEVPSQMRSTRASRQKRASGRSLHQPHAAVDLDRLVGHPRQHLRAYTLADAISRSAGRPRSRRHAAASVSQSAASISVIMSASLNETPGSGRWAARTAGARPRGPAPDRTPAAPARRSSPPP